MKKNNSIDLTGKNRQLKCSYHGKHSLDFLEGIIYDETNFELIVGVSLTKKEIQSYKYDPVRKSLDVWYQHCGSIAGSCFEELRLPKDIKEINVYDVGQKII